MRHHRPGLHEVGAAEGGKEIVQRQLVRQILDRDRSGDARTLFRMEEVVAPETEIEEAARLDAVGIVIIIFSPGLRQRQQLRSPFAGLVNSAALVILPVESFLTQSGWSSFLQQLGAILRAD